jgi:lysophospholipase L1-like esterase
MLSTNSLNPSRIGPKEFYVRTSRITAIGFFGVLWLLCALLVAEILIRKFAHPPVALTAYDPVLGWRYARHARIAGGVPLSTNGAGFRDVDHEIAVKPGTFRILLLGDSYAAGTAVGDGLNFPRVLESRLLPGAEVVNASVSAWSTDQELLYYRGEGRELKPDLVLVAIVPNDIRENYGKKNFSQNAAGDLAENSMPRVSLSDRLLWFLLNHSSITQWLAQRYDFGDVFQLISKYHHFTFPVGRDPSNDADVLHDPPAKEVFQARALFEALILQLRKTVEANHGVLALTVLPTKMEFDKPSPYRAVITPGFVSDYVKGFAQRSGIPFFDLFSVLKKERDPLSYFIAEEYHFNEAGHRFIGEQLAAQIGQFRKKLHR